MADRPGEHEPERSSDAVRNAAEELKSADVQGAVRAAQGDLGNPPPDVDEPPEPEPAEDQGRTEPESDSPRVRASEADDDKGKDFDPEDRAVYPEEDGEGPEKTAAPPETQPQPTPEGLSPKDKQLWEQFQAFREAQEAGTIEDAATRQAKPEVEVPDLETTIKGLIDNDPEISAKVGQLGSNKREREALETRGAKINEQIGALSSDVGKLQHLVEYHEELLKTDPEDLDVSSKLRDFRIQLSDTRSRLHEQNMEMRDLRSEYAERTSEFERVRIEIRQRGEQEVERIRDTNTRQATYDDDYDRGHQEWSEALPKAMEDAKLHPSMAEEVEQLLAYRIQGEEQAPDDVGAWMASQMPVITSLLSKHRDQELQTYAAAKRRDADQPAPKGSKAVASRREEGRDGRLSSREASLQSQRALTRELGGR